MKKFLLILSLHLILLNACSTAGFKNEQGFTEFVSLVKLISVPEGFEGKEVITIGVLSIKESLLYLSIQDAEHSIIPNSLSLDFGLPEFPREKAVMYHGMYVSVKGRIEASSDGFGNISSGIMYDIKEVYPEEEWRH